MRLTITPLLLSTLVLASCERAPSSPAVSAALVQRAEWSLPVSATAAQPDLVRAPDGGLLLTASWDRTAKLWSADAGECLRTLVGHQGIVFSAVFSPDGGFVLTASVDRTAKLWSAESGECLRTLEGHSAGVWSAAFSPHLRGEGVFG